MDNTLPEDRPDISGERIKYIDKGTEVKLVYKVKIFKKGWWIFNDTVTVQGKSEIVITRTLKKDIITKIYTVKEYSNVSGIEGLVEESEFNGSILDKDLFKKEKLKKLREAFFEKELTFLINYDLINLSVGGSYYIESKGEYISYVPIFGSGEPRNFYTNTKKSSRITFDGYLTGITSSASRITAPFFDIRYKKFIIDKIKYLLSVLQSN